jgi:fused signal recognition particle receptor
MFKFLKEKLHDWTKKISEESKKSEEESESKTKKIQKIIDKAARGPSIDESYRGMPLGKSARKLKEEKKEIKIPLKVSYPFIGPDTEYLEKELEKIKEEEKEEEENLFSRIKSKVQKVKLNEEQFEVYAEELEMLLLENNVALEVAEKIINELKERIVGKELLKKEVEGYIDETFKDIIREILIKPFDIIEKIKLKSADGNEPFVILFCGINGSGKTTTIAKIADYLKKKKISCVMAAADTFRAAAIQQLEEHGKKIGIKVISHDYGSDPASVGFDAIKYAEKNRINCVLIDTAGRMHTSKDLMREIEKISRVCRPDLKIFVAESITGNDAIEQAKSFNFSIGIDAIVLTKQDIDEKGGTSLSVGYVTKKPILFLGTGQLYESIEPFDKEKFIEKLGL